MSGSLFTIILKMKRGENSESTEYIADYDRRARADVQQHLRASTGADAFYGPVGTARRDVRQRLLQFAAVPAFADVVYDWTLYPPDRRL